MRLNKSVRVGVLVSVHPDFDARIWKQVLSLAEAGYQVNLVSTWDAGKIERIPEGILFHSFVREPSRLRRLYRHPFRIWKIISGSRFDVYHFHEFEMLPFTAVCTILFRRPFIYDIHEIYHLQIRAHVPAFLRPMATFLIYWIEWFFAAIIRNLIVVVPLQEKHFRGSRFNIQRIHNYASCKILALRTDDYQQRPDAVIFTGSQYVDNGSLLLIEIAREVHARRPQVRFLNVDRFKGQEQFRRLVMEMIARYNLTEIFDFLPNVLPHEIMLNLNRATIAISPSLRVRRQSEAIPTKLFEYLAAGLPVVTSNLPYQKEVIEGNRVGFCVRPEEPADFAEKIVYLVDHRDESAEMGRRAMQIFSEKYCWENKAKTLINFYRHILGDSND